jgi:hypothetical protein
MSHLLKEAIYFIHPKEYLDNNEKIYKIGRTRRMVDNRLKEYEEGCNVLLTVNVNNSLTIENKICEIFRNNFKLVRGREYFEGNFVKMRRIIYNLAENEVDILGIEENEKFNESSDDEIDEEVDEEVDEEEVTKQKTLKNKLEYECDRCHKKFYMLSAFKDHIKSDVACSIMLNKKFKCDNCDKCFTTEKAKKYHMVSSCKNK